MLRFFLPSVAALLAVLSSLAWVPAPAWPGLWKVALAAGEFGHWFIVLPLALAVAALFTLTGWPQAVVLVFCAAAAVQLALPSWQAARIAARLPEEMSAAFGPEEPAGVPSPWSWSRLYVSPAATRGPVRTEVFVRREGGALELDFYPAATPGDAGGAPCLVVVHGGGWDGGDRAQLAGWNHRWAARGYAVAAISYRLAPAHPWPAQREDVRAALAWLREHAVRLGVDPERLVLVGRSAGGQIAAAVGYDAGVPGVAGVISFYAPQDMEFAWGVSREDDALNSVRLMRQYLGGPPDTPERRALYASASAQLMVGARTPPTLLLHGRPDTLVWHRHSERLAGRLREAGVPHHLLRLPWATHAFDYNPDGPGGQLADYATARFLRRITRRD